MTGSLRHLLVLAGVLLLALPAAPPAFATDLHRLFEEQCASCHGDAGPFAQKALTRRPLNEEQMIRFLRRHGAGLPADHVAALAEMLVAQANTPPWFREECGICHGRAAPFVRDRMILRDGALVDRYTNEAVADVLTHHAALPPERQAFYLDLLRRLERELHHP